MHKSARPRGGHSRWGLGEGLRREERRERERGSREGMGCRGVELRLSGIIFIAREKWRIGCRAAIDVDRTSSVLCAAPALRPRS